MEKVKAFIAQKKVYVTAILAGIATTLTMLGYDIPAWVYAAVSAVGLGQ